MLCLVLLLGPVFVLGCGTYTCNIFNCNTLFFLEDWVEAQGQMTDADGEDAGHMDELTEG